MEKPKIHPAIKVTSKAMFTSIALLSLNYFSLLIEALTALLSNMLSFRLGNFQVSIAVTPGAPPQKLTFSVVMAALAAVMVGSVGSFASGDFTITISPYTGDVYSDHT
jgi:hypothetical protein